MPFKSEKQRRYLWANEPEIARDWTNTYGSRIQKNTGGITRIPFQGGGAGWQDADWSGDLDMGSGYHESTPSSNNNQSAVTSDEGWENVQSSESFNVPGWDKPGTTNKQIIQGGETWQAKTDKEVKKDIKDRKNQEIIDAGGDKNNDGKISWVEKYNYNWQNKQQNYYNKSTKESLAKRLNRQLKTDMFNSNMTIEELMAGVENLNKAGVMTNWDGDPQKDWQKYAGTGSGWLGAIGKYGGAKNFSYEDAMTYINKLKAGPEEWKNPDSNEADWLQQMAFYQPNRYALHTGQTYNPRTGQFTPKPDGGGGSNFPVRTAPYIPGEGINKPEEDVTTDQFQLASTAYPYASYGTTNYPTSSTFQAYLAKGGRVPAAFGGIMDTETGRRGYFLGSIKDAIGDVAKAAGKVLKSDVGKLALLGAGAYFGPMAFGKAAGFGSWGQIVPKTGWMANLLRSKGAVEGTFGGLSPWKLAGIGMTAAPFLGIGTKAKQDTLGVADRGGKLIDPITGNESTPQEIRMSLNTAIEEAGNDPVKLAAINEAYPFLNLGTHLPYETYGVKDGGRIGAQEGGLMDLGGMEKDYRNNGGFVAIGGEERADDVPARLSRNEFVFTADAVRGAGGGDIDKGAEIMENVMKNLEQGGKISEESQGNTGAQEMFSVSQRIGEVL